MRRRILALVVGMTALVIVAFAVPIGLLLHSAVAQHAQRAAIDQANTVGLFLRSGAPTSAEIASYVKSVSESSRRPTSVTTPTGTVIGTVPVDGRPFDATGGRTPPNLGGSGAGPVPPGATGLTPSASLHSVTGGQLAETTARTTHGFYFIRVYLPNGALHSGELQWWFLLIGGSVGLLALSVVAAELLTRRIVRPLTRTAETAQLLALGNTTARAPTDGPREVAEVGSALNRLADRIDELIAEERETVADLSHRLRTPLTALRLDAEALQDSAEAERIGNQVSLLERMLTAIIHAARRPQREGRIPVADAAGLVRERVAFWSVLADEQERRATVRVPDTPQLVRAGPEDLAAAVDALLENVFAHTPEGTSFGVRVTPLSGAVLVEIEDDGPGLPQDAHIRGRSDRGSTGLGLDIARRCAEFSGGGMTINRSAAGGALITLRLGAAS